ncbi:histidine-containing phosphotransfer protein 2-like [Jatropha curcas]|uniref:histidine-containing phosphotransfer protein 2-like n=1 Tax=Jatropha curcas TaxID=180498 RepID=UPI0018934354|nr:histidine-containing phosphotransfer protein 2-like [Jatropha curcas]
MFNPSLSNYITQCFFSSNQGLTSTSTLSILSCAFELTLMALPALKAQLNNFVKSMFDEEVLDRQFTQIQALQDESNPNFVAEVITSFCNDAERIITELNTYLAQPNVDFSNMESCVHQLKGSSSSIGAQRLKLACADLQQAFHDKNKGGCLQALNTITHEYCLLGSKFETLIQLEKSIQHEQESYHVE